LDFSEFLMIWISPIFRAFLALPPDSTWFTSDFASKFEKISKNIGQNNEEKSKKIGGGQKIGKYPKI